MTDNIQTVLKAKPFPNWIKNHSIFKSYKEVKKVFPSIGLVNCVKEIQIDNSKAAKQAAQSTVISLREELKERLRTIQKFAAKKDITAKRKAKLDACIHLLESLSKQMNKIADIDQFIITNNGRITLNLPKDVVDAAGKEVFKSGEGLFRVYNKLNETLRAGKFLAMEKLDNLPQFKTFSSSNVPALTYKVVFSSTDTDGLWDIATMSMRGIQSCQTWGSSSGHSAAIVGSMIDPFTGIIYLTSGKGDEYGSKMIRRCVVRFVVERRSKKPFIMLEYMYPSYDAATMKQFKALIQERTDNKFEVKYTDKGNLSSAYVPMSKAVRSLEPHEQPYRDSHIAYEEDLRFQSMNARLGITEKVRKFCETFAAKILSTARAMKVSEVDDASKKAFKAMRGSEYYNANSYAICQELIAAFSNHIEANIQSDKVSSEEAYHKSVLTHLMSLNLSQFIESELQKTVELQIPSNYGKMSSNVVGRIATTSADKITAYLQKEHDKIKVKEEKLGKDVELPSYFSLLNH